MQQPHALHALESGSIPDHAGQRSRTRAPPSRPPDPRALHLRSRVQARGRGRATPRDAVRLGSSAAGAGYALGWCANAGGSGQPRRKASLRAGRHQHAPVPRRAFRRASNRGQSMASTTGGAAFTALYGGHVATAYHSRWWWAAAKADGDLGFHCTTRAGARLLAKHGNPTFLYSFEPSEWPTDVIGHCSEKNLIIDGADGSTSLRKLGTAMAEAWHAFVATGVPGAGWPRYTAETDQHMLWDGSGKSTGKASDGLRKEQCDFWDRQGFPGPY